MEEKEFQDEEFISGETKIITFGFFDEDSSPIDVSPFTPTLRVCYLEDKSYVLLEKQGTAVPNEIGEVEFILNSDDTEGWEDGSYLFQAELRSVSGTVIKGEGAWRINGGL